MGRQSRIKEGKEATHWTRLSCHRFRANEVRLLLGSSPTTWVISCGGSSCPLKRSRRLKRRTFLLLCAAAGGSLAVEAQMGIGPVPAMRAVLDRAKLGVGDLDVIEVNEAFAAQALAVTRDLGLPDDRTNPNGSGISLGHPIGATGGILTAKALYRLHHATSP